MPILLSVFFWHFHLPNSDGIWFFYSFCFQENNDMLLDILMFLALTDVYMSLPYLWHNWCFISLQSSHWSSTVGLFGLTPVLMKITFEYAYEIFLSVFIDFMRLVLGFWKRFFDPFICIIIPSHTLSTFCQTSYLCSRFLRLTTNFPSLLKYAHLSQNFITSPCSQLSPNPVVEKKKKFSCSLLHIKVLC